MFRLSKKLGQKLAFPIPSFAVPQPKSGSIVEKAKGILRKNAPPPNSPQSGLSPISGVSGSRPSLMTRYHELRAFLRNPPRGIFIRRLMLDSELHNTIFILVAAGSLAPIGYRNVKTCSNFAEYGYWNWWDLPTSLYCTFHMIRRDLQHTSQFVQEFRTRCGDDLEKREKFREFHGGSKHAAPWWENLGVGYRRREAS